MLKIRGIDDQVSIHVPLAEHDALLETMENAWQVSIHVPLAEHDFSNGGF